MINIKEYLEINPSMKLKIYLKNPVVEFTHLKQMIDNIKNKRLLNIVIAPMDKDFDRYNNEWLKLNNIRKIQLQLRVIFMKFHYKYLFIKSNISSFILLA